MYALTETTITERKSVVAPVISNIRTIPVIGALRTAEIYPAIPSIIKLLKKLFLQKNLIVKERIATKIVAVHDF